MLTTFQHCNVEISTLECCQHFNVEFNISTLKVPDINPTQATREATREVTREVTREATREATQGGHTGGKKHNNH